tara:strand:- start:21877 stop:22446 length:570 start_codon:yes stop_codon:yes gene_type:complete
MWVWRAFIFSLGIALFAATTTPARATEHQLQLSNLALYSQTQLPDDVVELNSVKANISFEPSPTALLTERALFTHKSASKKQSRDRNEHSESDSKTSAYEVRFNHNVSLPPFERQAASAFGSVFQSEPLFVLVHEFLPEILGVKYFLAPLAVSNAIPWYLRPDAPNSQSRLAGWKDGNTQYTGALTYLS